MKKKEQIIVRLSSEKKEELQNIAEELNTDMSVLIRDKIDEIIKEHKMFKENKKIVDNANAFINDNKNTLANKLVTEELIVELQGEFKKILIDKFNEELKDTSVLEVFSDK